MKNALVTGAAGFIGTQIVKVLVSKGYYVCALIEKSDIRGRVKLSTLSNNIEVIEKLNHGNEYKPFEKIYHTATVGVRPDFDNIDLICDINIKMGCNLVDFAKENQAGLLVNFGSCFEYGDHGDVLLTEDMECKPESLYAISKVASTSLVTTYAKQKTVNLITVRPFGVFGEGEGPARLAPSIINSLKNGQKIDTTAGQQIRDFVNVKDVAKAIVELSEAHYLPYEIYNICSDNPVKVRDFIEEIINVCGFDKNLVNFGALPYRNNEAMTFAGDNSKLQKVINYLFPDNHIEGILDIVKSIE